MRDRPAPLPIVAALVVAAMGFPRASARAEILAPQGSIEFGVDSFAQSYQLTDFTSDDLLESALRDTSEVITEWRAAANFDLKHRGDVWRTDLKSRLSAGTDLHRGSVDLGIDRRGERTRWELDLRSSARLFREASEYRLSSDTGELQARSRFLGDVGRGWSLGARARAKALRHERQSSYERDANTGEVAAVARWESGWSQYADVEVGFARQNVPDSLAISYRRSFARGQVAGRIGERWELRAESMVERRHYDDTGTRSAFSSIYLETSAEYRFDDRWALRWESPVEWVDYETADDIYFDFFLGHTGLELIRRVGSLELAVAPRLAWLRAPAPREDEYAQFGGRIRADWFSTGRLWLSITEELGWRDHREVPDSEFEIYSDYWFLRSSLVAGLRVFEQWTVEGFLTDEPETHRRAEDDSRLTLVSLSLRYSF